ncbi:DUF5977 domain-containing protein [Dyadobacter diqingensis]|uniref:DUF5977 domain-containing protein n=1 Tax=Dyadobacter diqingensis TaxID=2938121 RepID=UPI0020C34E73|nr:DUF5977 domain-containing protein [Dyadobacter diqingensis]
MIDAIATDQSYLPLKFSRNKLTHTIEAADPGLISRVGLKYYLAIQVPEFPFSENFEELHTSEGREAPVDNQSGVQIFAGAEFRFNSGRNGKIDGLLTYAKPRHKQAQMTISLSQTLAFTLREEIRGGMPAVNISNQLGKMYAIKAGLANEDFYAYGDSFFKSWQSNAKQFLTWQPNFKSIAPTQEEYLSFVLNFTPKPQTLKLRVQAYGADGAISETVTAMSLQNPVLYSVICCPVGASILKLPSTIAKYDVWLSNENNQRVSEVRTYLIDRTDQEFERSVLFVNSLGGWDTLRLTGQAQRNLKVSQNTAQTERPANAGVDFSELKIISIEGEYDLQVSTGFFKRDAIAYLNYLDELLLSEEVFLVSSKGHRPLQLTTQSLTDQEDNQGLVARTFGFRILDTVENFSSLPAAQPTEPRATTWRGVSLKQVLDGYGKRTGKLAFERLEKVYLDNNTPVKPYTVKANSQGDPDYVEPVTDSSIAPGSTPFPNTQISRLGTFNRTTCGDGYLGGAATILIAANTYGGEKSGDADALAEAKYNSMNTQAFADASGTCTLNNVPLRFGIRHYFPMNLNNQIVGSADYGPVVNLRISGTEIIPNCTGSNPITTRLSDAEFPPGKYNFILQVLYQASPQRQCKIKLAAKNREITVTEPGYFVFDNVIVNSSDAPLIFEITPV